MPLYLYRPIHPEGVIGVWHMAEDEAYFRQHLELFPDEVALLASIPGQGRRTEWLAVRYLLHVLSGHTYRGAVTKDEYGKPHLSNSNYQISFSHSDQLVAVAAAPTAVGIDIQKFVPKIERIAHRFLCEQENSRLHHADRNWQLHYHWCAKEAMYKAYGRRQLDFCQNIRVHPIGHTGMDGHSSGWVRKDAFEAEYDLYYEQINDYLMVWAVEKR